MNLFELTAYAAGTTPSAAAGSSNMLMGILPFVLIFGVMYFLMIRPQKKKDKLKQEMLSQLTKGDKILTIGGIHGKIISVKDDNIIIETGDVSPEKKSYLKILRGAVAEVTKPADEPSEGKKESEEKDAE